MLVSSESIRTLPSATVTVAVGLIVLGAFGFVIELACALAMVVAITCMVAGFEIPLVLQSWGMQVCYVIGGGLVLCAGLFARLVWVSDKAWASSAPAVH